VFVYGTESAGARYPSRPPPSTSRDILHSAVCLLELRALLVDIIVTLSWSATLALALLVWMLRSLNMWRLSIAAGRLAQPRFATKLTRNACPCALRAYSCAATARIPHAANVTRSWLLGRPQSRKLAPVAGPVLSARTLFIQTADTPNPHSKKFYPGYVPKVQMIFPVLTQ
jgi:hypothetical protein